MSNLTLKEIQDLIMQQAEEKGWGIKPEDISIPEKIALIHSEISEAFEAYRHKNINAEHGFNEELGDAVTRILHLCGILNIDLEKEILNKLESNKTRTWNWKNMNEKSTFESTQLPDDQQP
jgi:NTP pyrophosphatase (non-canonical NTP hydrolase)